MDKPTSTTGPYFEWQLPLQCKPGPIHLANCVDGLPFYVFA